MRPVASAQTVALAPYALTGRLTRLHSGTRHDTLEARARDAASLMRPVAPLRPFDLASADGAHATATLFPCGHVLGACSIRIDIQRGESFQRIFYLPDFSVHDQAVVPGASFPKHDPERPIDLLLMEGVLGANAPADAFEYEAGLAALLDSLEASGPRLLALAAIGQAPELAHALVARGHSPVVHEMMRPVFDVYAREGARFEGVRYEDLRGCARALDAGGIVLAPDQHLVAGSPSHALASGRSHVDLVTLNAVREGALNERARRVLLPDHAPRWALKGAAKALSPKRIALVHGAPRALKLAARALGRAGHDAFVPNNLARIVVE